MGQARPAVRAKGGLYIFEGLVKKSKKTENKKRGAPDGSVGYRLVLLATRLPFDPHVGHCELLHLPQLPVD